MSGTELVSTEINDSGEQFQIVREGAVLRCTRCDAMDVETRHPLNPKGIGTTEKDWKQHADTVHRSRVSWKYRDDATGGNGWYQTFS